VYIIDSDLKQKVTPVQSGGVWSVMIGGVYFTDATTLAALIATIQVYHSMVAV
jgi:hypothetical protein